MGFVRFHAARGGAARRNTDRRGARSAGLAQLCDMRRRKYAAGAGDNTVRKAGAGVVRKAPEGRGIFPEDHRPGKPKGKQDRRLRAAWRAAVRRDTASGNRSLDRGACRGSAAAPHEKGVFRDTARRADKRNNSYADNKRRRFPDKLNTFLL